MLIHDIKLVIMKENFLGNGDVFVMLAFSGRVTKLSRCRGKLFQ